MIAKAKIGAIQIDGDTIHVAVVKTGRQVPHVLELQSRTAVYELPEQRCDALTQALDEVLESLRNKPAVYVLCIPCTETIVRPLTIPFRGASRVAKAVPFEIEPYLAFPLEELLLDYSCIAEIAGETEVLAVGARRKQVEEALAILDKAGVDTELAGVDVAGMTALWLSLNRHPKGLQAILHVRRNQSVLAIVYNKTLAYFRNLNIGEEQILERSAAAAREIQNSLRAFQAKWRAGGEFDRVHISGIELPEQTQDVLEQVIGMPVHSSCLVELLPGGSQALQSAGLSCAANQWEPVIGVAHNAGGAWPAFNLIRDSQSMHGSVRSVVAHLMFSSCLALLFLLGCAWYYHEGRIRNENAVAFAREKIAAVKAEIEAMAAEGLGEDVEVSIFNDPTLLDLLLDLSRRMPENKAIISEIRLSPPGTRGGWLAISGSTPNAADFNQVFEELRKSEYFKCPEDPVIRLQGEKTTFQIRAFRPNEEVTDEPQS